MMESQIYMKIVRLLYYLPMERMTVKYVIDGKDYVTLPLYEMLEDKYKQLEEENKKLKEENEKLKKENISLHIEIEEIQDDGELSYEEKLLYD